MLLLTFNILKKLEIVNQELASLRKSYLNQEDIDNLVKELTGDTKKTKSKK